MSKDATPTIAELRKRMNDTALPDSARIEAAKEILRVGWGALDKRYPVGLTVPQGRTIRSHSTGAFMPDARKQTRISLPPDVARDFEESKRRAEEAAGVTFTDAQYLLALVKAEIERRKSNAG